MSKKTSMNGDTLKKKKKNKRKIKKKKEKREEANSCETMSLCSPKAKNTIEMSLLHIKFFLLNCDLLF